MNFRFDQDVIGEIRARIEIAGLIGAYVQLRKRGRDLVGLCPFHGEKTPSFHVHPDRGFFKCFGCGAGGDVITFVQRYENLEFRDAVRVLAERAGITLEPETPQSVRRRSEREAIVEANRIAVAFFEREFRAAGGAAARAYCERRGIGAAAIERFHLGYAPDTWDALLGELRREGVDAQTAVNAGLLKQGERGYYDFYRDRLIIPTYATTGEPIAFGGRALGDGEPKYLNTATTPVYTKGRHLFALNLARRSVNDGALIVVEGYLDCIALHQAGFENSVASLGTAFTDEQARELRKYAEGVFLCFDGDAAGNAAAVKAVEIAAKAIEHAGSAVRIVSLPPGEDPDTFVRSRGAQAFAGLLATAAPAIEFRLEREVERLQRGFDAPAAIAREAEETIRRLVPTVEWDRWRVWIAKRLKVSENDLRNSRFRSNGSNFGPRTFTTAGSRHAAVSAQAPSFEHDVLAILLEEPKLVADYAVRIPLERFRTPGYRRIYGRLLDEADRLRTTSDVFGLFTDDNESMAMLGALGAPDRSSAVRYTSTDERRAHLDRVVERLQREDDRQRYRELSDKIDELMTAGQNVGSDLRGEYDALVAKLKR